MTFILVLYHGFIEKSAWVMNMMTESQALLHLKEVPGSYWMAESQLYLKEVPGSWMAESQLYLKEVPVSWMAESQLYLKEVPGSWLGPHAWVMAAGWTVSASAS
jgi:hypothetical protein